MQAVQEKIGDVDVLIQTLDDRVSVVNQSHSGPAISDTSIQDRAKDAYVRAKSIIRAFAEDIGNDLGNLRIEEGANLSSMEVEFSMGFSTQLGVWVLGAQGQGALSVRMTWEMPKDEEG